MWNVRPDLGEGCSLAPEQGCGSLCLRNGGEFNPKYLVGQSAKTRERGKRGPAGQNLKTRHEWGSEVQLEL